MTRNSAEVSPPVGKLLGCRCVQQVQGLALERGTPSKKQPAQRGRDKRAGPAREAVSGEGSGLHIHWPDTIRCSVQEGGRWSEMPPCLRCP